MRIFLILIILFSSNPCFASNLTAEITQLLKEQNEAWNRGDLRSFVRPYDDSGSLVFVSSVVIRSADELRERYEKRYGSGKSDFGKLTFSELKVEELAPGLARAWGRWSVEQKDKQSAGWFTLILQKQDGHWRIIHDHSSYHRVTEPRRKNKSFFYSVSLCLCVKRAYIP
jgi:uncharacterized protein (TIGR02246 family)